jgi:hypothetical protein
MENGENAADPQELPYRWGYFQGVALVPWSLFALVGFVEEIGKSQPYPLYYIAVAILMAVLGLPLSFGLLWKKKFALTLLYVMLVLSILLASIQIPIAIIHFRDPGSKGSALPEAEILFIWLLSLIYYRRRRSQFR